MTLTRTFIHAGNPCTGPDSDANCSESCDEGADNCSAADPNGSICDDGDVCSTGDTCSAGSCSAGAPLDYQETYSVMLEDADNPQIFFECYFLVFPR